MSWLKTKFPRMRPDIKTLPALDYHQEEPLVMTLDPCTARSNTLVKIFGYEIDDDCIVLFGKKKAIRPISVEDHRPTSYRPLDKYAVTRYRHKRARIVTFRVPKEGKGSVIVRIVNPSSTHQLVSRPKAFTFIPSWSEDEMLEATRVLMGQEESYVVPEPELLEEPELQEIPDEKPLIEPPAEEAKKDEKDAKPAEEGKEGDKKEDEDAKKTASDDKGGEGSKPAEGEAAKADETAAGKDAMQVDTPTTGATTDSEAVTATSGEGAGEGEKKDGDEGASANPGSAPTEDKADDGTPATEPAAESSGDAKQDVSVKQEGDAPPGVEPVDAMDTSDVAPQADANANGASGGDGSTAAPAPAPTASGVLVRPPPAATDGAAPSDAQPQAGEGAAAAAAPSMATPADVSNASNGTSAPGAPVVPGGALAIPQALPKLPPDDFIELVPDPNAPVLTYENEQEDTELSLMGRLMLAATIGYAKVVSLILDTNTISPNTRDFLGQTPAHHAAAGGHLSILKLLETYGADFALRDGEGLVPADTAAHNHRTLCLDYLKDQSPPLAGRVFNDAPTLNHTLPIRHYAPRTNTHAPSDLKERLISAMWIDQYPDLFLDSDDEEEGNTVEGPRDNMGHYKDHRVCAFCHRAEADSDVTVYGKMLGPYDDYWCHENCILWSKCVQFRRCPQNRKSRGEGPAPLLPLNVPSEVKRACQHMCSRCGILGANLQCRVPNCSRRYHFACALDDDCQFRFRDHHAVICPVHVPMEHGEAYGDIPRNPELEARKKKEEEEERMKRSRMQVVPTVSTAKHLRPLVPSSSITRSYAMPPRRNSGSRPRRDSGPPPRFEPVGPRPRRDSGGQPPKPRRRSKSTSSSKGSKPPQQTVKIAPEVKAAIRKLNQAAKAAGKAATGPHAGQKRKRSRSRTMSTGSSTDLSDTNYRERRSTRRDSEKAEWFCQHCGIPDTETPARRPGPNGSSTLCNACGCYYKKHQRLPENPEARRLKHLKKKKKKKPPAAPSS